MPRKKKKPSKWKKTGAIGLTVGQFLLEKFLELSEIFPTIETPRAYGRRLDGWPKEFPRHRIKHELKRMKDRGWIEEAEKQGKKFLKLTKKGYLRALYRKIKIIPRHPKKLWDEKWRLALFDIPEKDGRRERDAIRWTLKSAGFYHLQKSVYVYPHEIPGEVIAYLKNSGLLPFIRFARVDRMDDTNDLLKHFEL